MEGVTGERVRKAAALVAACSLLVLAGCGSDEAGDPPEANSAAAKSTGKFATLPTKKCPTTQAIERPAVTLDATTTVPAPSDSLEGFAAFTNTNGAVLIGPAAWECSSSVSADGGANIGLSPDGSDPFEDGAEIGVTYDASSACQGCIAAEICAVLPDAPVVLEYAGSGIGCDRKKPLKEELTPIGDLSVLFEDPPGVKGQGTPSGGSVRSTGMLTYSEYRGVQQVSCALPEELTASCPAVISGSMLHALAYLRQG